MAILKSAFTISFFTLISRILGFIRDVMIAKFMGVSMLSDVFFAAFRLPNFFRRIFAEGAFNSAFVPIFVAKVENKTNFDKALTFARNIFSLLLYALILLIVLMQIFMPFVIRSLFPGFEYGSDKFLLLVDLSRITIFYLIFISLVSLLCGILNSVSKFAAAASVPIILNLTLIASLYLLSDYSKNLAFALSWGIFIAGIIQFIWISLFLIKKRMFVYPIIPKITPDTRKFIKKLIPGIIGANVMQINLLVDTIIASLIPGAISYLYYADRINQLPLAMIGIAIGVALLPALSKKIRDKKQKEAIKLQNIAMQVALMLVIPASFALFILSNEIISVLFEHGEFTRESTIMVGKALAIYSIGLPAYVLVKIFEPSFFARGNTKTPMKIAMICLICNVLLNALFFFPFGYLGIILASIISSYLNLGLLLYKLMKNNNFKFEDGYIKKISNTIMSAVTMVFVIMIANSIINDVNQILKLGLLISIGFFTYLGISYFIGNLKFLVKNIKKANI